MAQLSAIELNNHRIRRGGEYLAEGVVLGCQAPQLRQPFDNLIGGTGKTATNSELVKQRA